MSQRGADALAQAMAAEGVTRVFSLSGNQIMPVYDACIDAGIDIVHTRHEAAAVHMADAFMRVVNQKPVRVRATAWSQKLPSLKPIAVEGYDLCDTQVTFANGGVAHIITGWHLPNAAHALTVQSSRIICTDGMIDLALDQSGNNIDALDRLHDGAIDLGDAGRDPVFGLGLVHWSGACRAGA